MVVIGRFACSSKLNTKHSKLNTVFAAPLPGVDFVYKIAPSSISVAPDIENYLNFTLTMFLAFGVTFEVPIVVLILVRMAVVTVEQVIGFRPYFIVGSFVVAAIVTPPDVLSQLLLAIPMCLLYEVGILAARVFGKTRPRDDGQPEET